MFFNFFSRGEERKQEITKQKNLGKDSVGTVFLIMTNKDAMVQYSGCFFEIKVAESPKAWYCIIGDGAHGVRLANSQWQINHEEIQP